MSLTYDQRSEIRMAFDEAFVEPERRRAMRVKHIVNAEISEWKKGKEGLPFTVCVEDFSPTGVGMIHGCALPVDSQFLIKVPRPKWGELVVLMTVARCVQMEDGNFRIGLELSSVMDQTELGKFVDALHVERRTSQRTKILLLLLGIVGIGLSLFLN
jgi:c-di-GMP-binding flagellar brake protein YcgR